LILIRKRDLSAIKLVLFLKECPKFIGHTVQGAWEKSTRLIVIYNSI